uniref:DnaA ATPase domain-containing protein n=1 Tax=Orrella sp. TaxID=1921583 RepID=UPI004055891A
MDEFWQSCLTQLEQELPPQQVNAWIRPLMPVGYDASTGHLRLSAPNRFKLDWVKKNFADRIEQIAQTWFGQKTVVILELAANINQNISQPSAPTIATDRSVEQPPVVQQKPTTAQLFGVTPAATTLSNDHSRLNDNLSFDNFVTGKANQLARAAALQVSENPGTSYNPLFLYGGVGLGKTHLIHAIGNAVIATRSQARVRYVHADQYVSDVVKAYQRKAFDDFKRYYHSLDLLLIDDIQFFSGKSRTQEEFFYAFEAMVA